MKHKTTPRGGAGCDPDIIDGLDEYQTEEARRAAEALMKATPEELGRAAMNQSRGDLQAEKGEPTVGRREAREGFKIVECSGPRCANRRIHHERPDTPRGIQHVEVPQDHEAPAFCSIECMMYYQGVQREKENDKP